MVPAGAITELFRYPVKGLSHEALDVMELRAGAGLEGDRAFALALGSTVFDEAAPVPLAKTNFLMLARDEMLAGLRTSYDPGTGRFRIAELVEADLRTVEGRAAVSRFFTALAGEAARGEARVVTAPGHRFTDVGGSVPAFMNCVSLINLASLRELEAKMGRTLDRLRFRANIYVDGLPAWSELGWIGQEIRVAGVPFRVVRATKRCPATNVNPATAQRDAEVPKALVAHYGHPNLGVYLEVLQDAVLRVGDGVEAPGS